MDSVSTSVVKDICCMYVIQAISEFQNMHASKNQNAKTSASSEKTGRRVGYVSSALGGVSYACGAGPTGKIVVDQTLGRLNKKKNHKASKAYACKMPYNFEDFADTLKSQLVDLFSLYLYQIKQISCEKCVTSLPNGSSTSLYNGEATKQCDCKTRAAIKLAHESVERCYNSITEGEFDINDQSKPAFLTAILTERGDAKTGHTISLNGKKDKASHLFDYPTPFQISSETKLPHIYPINVSSQVNTNNYGFRIKHDKEQILTESQEAGLDPLVAKRLSEQNEFRKQFLTEKPGILARIDEMERTRTESAMTNMKHDIEEGLENIGEKTDVNGNKIDTNGHKIDTNGHKIDDTRQKLEKKMDKVIDSVQVLLQGNQVPQNVIQVSDGATYVAGPVFNNVKNVKIDKRRKNKGDRRRPKKISAPHNGGSWKDNENTSSITTDTDVEASPSTSSSDVDMELQSDCCTNNVIDPMLMITQRVETKKNSKFECEFE